MVILELEGSRQLATREVEDLIRRFKEAEKQLSAGRQTAVTQAITQATLEIWRLASQQSPFDRGDLRAAHDSKVENSVGTVFINPSAVNPDGVRPSFYGPIVHAKHDPWFERVAQQQGPRVLRKAGQLLIDGLGKTFEQ